MKTNLSKITLSLATLVTLSTTVYAKNLLKNGSFENFKVQSSDLTGKTVLLSAWSGTAKVLTNKIGKKATAKRYKVALDRTANIDGLTQTVTLKKAKTYELSFDAYASLNTSSDVVVSMNGKVIETISPNADWSTHTIIFKARRTINTLKLEEVSSQADNAKGAIIDHLVLKEVSSATVLTPPNNTSTTTISDDANISKNVIFIAPNGSNTNRGTFNKPLADLGAYCGKDGLDLSGKTVYYRAGVYKNPAFGDDISVSHKSLSAITCYGTQGKPLTIKPWKKEHVKFKFDSAYGVQLVGSHLRFEGFEIEGMSQEINFDQAVEAWWDGSNYFNGQGLNVQGVDVEVRNNIIHDVPGAGINTRGNAIVDRLKIDNNIIFNTSWGSTGGTTALGIVGANRDTNADTFDGSKVGIEITNNLIFSSESRIFSHVFSKGFSNLTIDEGSTMLLKRYKGSKKGTYNKGFLVEGNHFLFNGKGVSLRWNDIEMRHNTFYNNGTTMNGSGAGVRSSEATDMTIDGNVIYISNRRGLNAIDFNKDSTTIAECTNNRYYSLDGDKSLKNPLRCAVDETQNNTLLSSSPFVNVENNDFRLTNDGDLGASQELLERQIDRLKEYGYELKPTNYKRKIKKN